jgi:hypothetical protein
MSDLQEIARTVSRLATPGIKPKDLVAAVRKRHPDASKKQVSRAAFMAMIIAAIRTVPRNFRSWRWGHGAATTKCQV